MIADFSQESVVDAYKNRRLLRSRVKELSRTLVQIEKQLQEKERLLDVAERVNKVVDGIPLRVDRANVEDVSGVIQRWTNDYENVRDGGIGLRFCQWRESGGYDEVALIMSQPEAVARERALEWVISGKLPECFKEKMRMGQVSLHG